VLVVGDVMLDRYIYGELGIPFTDLSG
jgi:bifunctional ADP-heptose synthase (sugar kinase/adenylyltransferase)